MRWVLAVALGSCAHAPSPSAPAALVARPEPARCDDRPSVDTTRRAWLGSEPVIVIDTAGDDVEVAATRDNVLSFRWVSVHALGRAVVADTPVSPAPGAPGNPALQLLPGFPLPATGGAWLAVHATGPVELDGYVPVSARGIFWDEPPPNYDDRRPTQAFVVRDGVRDDARVLATIGAGVQLRIRTEGGVSAYGGRARVDGYLAPTTPPRVFDAVVPSDASERELDVESPAGWLPVGACLRDAPGGRIVGQVVGAVGKPRAALPGWSALDVKTAWGNATYYTDAPSLDPARAWTRWPHPGD